MYKTSIKCKEIDFFLFDKHCNMGKKRVTLVLKDEKVDALI